MAKINNKAVFDRLINKIDDIANFDFAKRTDSEIDAVVLDFIKKLRSELEKDETDASGALKASIAPMGKIIGNGVIKIQIGIDPHWKAVDEGTKPQGVTKENIKKLQPKIFNWIQEKGSLAAIASDKQLKRSLSFAITRNILKKGTIKRFGYKGTGFVTNNLPEFKQDIIKAFENAFKIK